MKNLLWSEIVVISPVGKYTALVFDYNWYREIRSRALQRLEVDITYSWHSDLYNFWVVKLTLLLNRNMSVFTLKHWSLHRASWIYWIACCTNFKKMVKSSAIFESQDIKSSAFVFACAVFVFLTDKYPCYWVETMIITRILIKQIIFLSCLLLGHRVLIFSLFTQMLDILEQYCKL